MLYISATLNERIFTGDGLRMKKKSIFAAEITLLIFIISFLHHRHLHAMTGILSYLLKNPASFEGYHYIYLGQKLCWTSVYLDK